MSTVMIVRMYFMTILMIAGEAAGILLPLGYYNILCYIWV